MISPPLPIYERNIRDIAFETYPKIYQYKKDQDENELFTFFQETLFSQQPTKIAAFTLEKTISEIIEHIKSTQAQTRLCNTHENKNQRIVPIYRGRDQNISHIYEVITHLVQKNIGLQISHDTASTLACETFSRFDQATLMSKPAQRNTLISEEFHELLKDECNREQLNYWLLHICSETALHEATSLLETERKKILYDHNFTVSQEAKYPFITKHLQESLKKNLGVGISMAVAASIAEHLSPIIDNSTHPYYTPLPEQWRKSLELLTNPEQTIQNFRSDSRALLGLFESLDIDSKFHWLNSYLTLEAKRCYPNYIEFSNYEQELAIVEFKVHLNKVLPEQLGLTLFGNAAFQISDHVLTCLKSNSTPDSRSAYTHNLFRFLGSKISSA